MFLPTVSLHQSDGAIVDQYRAPFDEDSPTDKKLFRCKFPLPKRGGKYTLKASFRLFPESVETDPKAATAKPVQLSSDPVLLTVTARKP